MPWGGLGHPRAPQGVLGHNFFVMDIHPTAGYVIRMDQTLHTKWRNVFGDHQEIDTDGNVEMGDDTNLYAPFAS